MDERLQKLQNSDTYQRLISIVRAGAGSITAIRITDNEISVMRGNDILFEHRPNAGFIFSINEQHFVYESIKGLLDSRYSFYTNLDNQGWKNSSPYSSISLKGASNW
jgi:hypothetical protein